MKVMIRRSEKGLSAYVPKKDLEEPIVETERDTLWGGSVKLKNGWTLILPDMPAGHAPADHGQRQEARRGGVIMTIVSGIAPAAAPSASSSDILSGDAARAAVAAMRAGLLADELVPYLGPARSVWRPSRRCRRRPRRLRPNCTSAPRRRRRSAPRCGRSPSSSRAGGIARRCRPDGRDLRRARRAEPVAPVPGRPAAVDAGRHLVTTARWRQRSGRAVGPTSSRSRV